MKKLILTITAIFLSTLLLSCGVDDSKAQMISSISISQSDNEVDVSYDFATESEAVEYYFDKIQAEQNSDTLQVHSNGSTGIYIYSLENIPQGFSIGNISDIDNAVYYNDIYRNSDSKTPDICDSNTIYFCMYRNTDGEEKLQERIASWTNKGYSVNEFSNKSGYYYVDRELSISVYWCEDGYCCLLQIPTSVGTVNPETHEYSGEDVFALKKTFYPFDDSAVAE